MTLTILTLLALAGIAYKVMSGEERARLSRTAADVLRLVKLAAHRRPEDKSFRDTLKGRTQWAFVTAAVIILNVTIFVFMIFGAGAVGDPKTLVGWGGSIAPRTTNGEWWRLVTSMFVHSGFVQLFVSVAGLIQVGLILERLIGRMSFAALYLGAGVFGSLVNLSAHQTTVGFGASAAIFGLYGLLLACSTWGLFHRSSVTIPLFALRRLAPAAAIFILYNVTNDSLDTAAELAGLATGFAYGLVLLIGASDPRPSPRRIAAVVGTIVVIAAASAITLRGIADVTPELERIVAAEDRAAGDYQIAEEQFRKRKITADALADSIDDPIISDLRDAQERLKAIHKVPKEQLPLLADAEEYLRVRSESWRLRAEAVRRIELRGLRDRAKVEPVSAADWRLRAEAQHRANLSTIGNADGKARASLEILQRIRTAIQQ